MFSVTARCPPPTHIRKIYSPQEAARRALGGLGGLVGMHASWLTGSGFSAVLTASRSSVTVVFTLVELPVPAGGQKLHLQDRHPLREGATLMRKCRVSKRQAAPAEFLDTPAAQGLMPNAHGSNLHSNNRAARVCGCVFVVVAVAWKR